MSARPFAGTVASLRSALDRHFVFADPGEAAWRGTVGPERAEVVASVAPGPGERPFVRFEAVAADGVPLDGGLARAIVLEHQQLWLGRFRHDGERVVLEETVLGGPTMDPEEPVAAAFAVGFAASAYGRRLQALRAGRDPGDVPAPLLNVRRGRRERVARAEERVERFLRETFGGFERDPSWGYHGGMGSAGVIVDVAPFLEDSTVVRAGSPVLSSVDLSDELALAVHAIAAAEALGRFVYVPERRELWLEHAVLGNALDREEVELVVQSVGRIADAHDDELARRFGGMRYADLRA